MAFAERNHVEDVSSSLRQITRLPSLIPGVEMIDPPVAPTRHAGRRPGIHALPDEKATPKAPHTPNNHHVPSQANIRT